MHTPIPFAPALVLAWTTVLAGSSGCGDAEPETLVALVAPDELGAFEVEAGSRAVLRYSAVFDKEDREVAIRDVQPNGFVRIRDLDGPVALDVHACDDTPAEASPATTFTPAEVGVGLTAGHLTCDRLSSQTCAVDVCLSVENRTTETVSVAFASELTLVEWVAEPGPWRTRQQAISAGDILELDVSVTSEPAPQ